MLLHESLTTTSKDIVNLPKHFKFFKNEIWTSNYKSAVVQMFRIKIKSKKRMLGDNFVELIQYDKPIYQYDNNTLYREFKTLEVGTINWYNQLTSQARYFIRNIDDILFNRLYNRLYNHDYLEYIEERYNRLYDYAVNNEKYDLLSEDLTSLKEDVFENNVVLGENIKIGYYGKYKRLLEYAFNHDESLLNEDKTDLSDETILKYLLLDESIPTPTVDKIRRSCSRSYEYIIDYARCNLDKFKMFVTLTFAEYEQKDLHLHYNDTRDTSDCNLKFIYVKDPKDYEECIKKFTSFKDNLKKKMKKKGLDLYYLGVPEYQTIGNIHFHLLMNELPSEFLYEIPSWLDYDYEINERRYGKGIKIWKYGKSDIEEIKDKDRVITYLAGYLMKSIKNLSETEYLDRLNKQRYYNSQNLIKPEVKINEDFTEEYNEIYYTTYQNVFNQSQTDKIVFSLHENN
ncbi:hypothetical protein KHQ81_10860 [Mycoplasmatota bacterium]|nr:hypothetical protein KHQ81_10860 [Mycoplasmatota bacterium]